MRRSGAVGLVRIARADGDGPSEAVLRLAATGVLYLHRRVALDRVVIPVAFERPDFSAVEVGLADDAVARLVRDRLPAPSAAGAARSNVVDLGSWRRARAGAT